MIDELVSGAVQRTYTYGHQRISENQLIESVWTPSYYEYDGEGSVRQLTSSAGTPTDTYEYDAFGNELNHTGITSNNYLYRGEQYDSDLSLYYLRARYYNPLTGRFLSVDSQAGEGQRRYEYAGADPVNGMDPTGNNDIIEFELLNFQPSPIMSWPKFCWVAGTNPMTYCANWLVEILQPPRSENPDLRNPALRRSVPFLLNPESRKRLLLALYSPATTTGSGAPFGEDRYSVTLFLAFTLFTAVSNNMSSLPP